MHATKETWVLAAAAMAFALVLTLLWSRWRDGARPELRGVLRPGAILAAVAAVAAAVAVAAAFYSSFGSDWQGPLDSILAYGTYLHRGSEGGIHSHPWYWYLELLVAYRPARGFLWTEGLIVALAAVGVVAGLARRGCANGAPQQVPSPGLCRFLAFYTVTLTVLCSAIPYKTPWCMLSFLHGMILLAGVGAWAILRHSPGWPLKALAGVLLAAALAHLGRECYLLNFRFPADQRNPYVYAHTSSDVLNLAAQMERLAAASAEGHAMVIHVLTPENYWPLPWYLRRFDPKRVGFWQDVKSWSLDTRQHPPPSVILVAPELQPDVDAKLRAGYNRQMIFCLRPEVFLAGYVREDLWEAFLAAQGGAAK
jgi:predicted membrane-bound mannosyltransferase